MAIDIEIIQRLNLLKGAPGFCLRDADESGNQEVLSIEVIPKDSGVYWVGGQTTLRNGTVLESVFVVDTSSGGTLVKTFWSIGNEWSVHDSEDTLTRLAASKDDVFPFDWSYSVPLEEDLYH